MIRIIAVQKTNTKNVYVFSGQGKGLTKYKIPTQ